VPFLAPASPEQLSEILDQTFPLWGEGLDRAGYESYNAAQRRTPWGSSHLQRLVLADGRRWLSTAKRYDFRVRLDGRDVSALGIGAVFTPEPLRRRGHAAELIERLVGQAAGEGASLALLFSEIGTGYYGSLGFSSVPLTQLRLEVAAPAGRAALPVRPGEARDLPAIAEMNALQRDGSRFSMIRDADYVGYAIEKKRILAAAGRPGHREVEFLVVEEGGRPAAYLVVLEVGDYWMVTECGDRDPAGARVGAMLETLVAARAQRPSCIRTWFPPAFRPQLVRAAAREVPALSMMVRAIGRGPALNLAMRRRDVAWWHADAF
jgi:hypothetical protein